jgi:hypothetical protein
MCKKREETCNTFGIVVGKTPRERSTFQTKTQMEVNVTAEVCNIDLADNDVVM